MSLGNEPLVLPNYALVPLEGLSNFFVGHDTTIETDITTWAIVPHEGHGEGGDSTVVIDTRQEFSTDTSARLTIHGSAVRYVLTPFDWQGIPPAGIEGHWTPTDVSATYLHDQNGFLSPGGATTVRQDLVFPDWAVSYPEPPALTGFNPGTKPNTLFTALAINTQEYSDNPPTPAAEPIYLDTSLPYPRKWIMDHQNWTLPVFWTRGTFWACFLQHFAQSARVRDLINLSSDGLTRVDEGAISRITVENVPDPYGTPLATDVPRHTIESLMCYLYEPPQHFGWPGQPMATALPRTVLLSGWQVFYPNYDYAGVFPGDTLDWKGTLATPRQVVKDLAGFLDRQRVMLGAFNPGYPTISDHDLDVVRRLCPMWYFRRLGLEKEFQNLAVGETLAILQKRATDGPGDLTNDEKAEVRHLVADTVKRSNRFRLVVFRADDVRTGNLGARPDFTSTRSEQLMDLLATLPGVEVRNEALTAEAVVVAVQSFFGQTVAL